MFFCIYPTSENPFFPATKNSISYPLPASPADSRSRIGRASKNPGTVLFAEVNASGRPAMGSFHKSRKISFGTEADIEVDIENLRRRWALALDMTAKNPEHRLAVSPLRRDDRSGSFRKEIISWKASRRTSRIRRRTIRRPSARRCSET